MSSVLDNKLALEGHGADLACSPTDSPRERAGQAYQHPHHPSLQ